MAVCEWCNREMTDHVSCTVTEFHLDGVPYALPPNRSRGVCGDCGTPPGGHHHPGCDIAPCPLCPLPMFTCCQRFDEDGPDDDDILDDDVDDYGNGPAWRDVVIPITVAGRDCFRPNNRSRTPRS